MHRIWEVSKSEYGQGHNPEAPVVDRQLLVIAKDISKLQAKAMAKYQVSSVSVTSRAYMH